MLSVTLLATEDDYYMAERQDFLERHALKLAAAWSDFDMVEHAAIEVVRRFGTTRANDHGLLRLHKEPLFLALQTACVVGYTRPFSENTGLDPKYSVYQKPEWQDLHETLFVWKERLCGEVGVSFRQFAVAPESQEKNDDSGGRYIIGEASSALEPQRHFSVLQEMCADRKALLWKHCQDAIAECYPVLYDQTLLSLSKLKVRL